MCINQYEAAPNCNKVDNCEVLKNIRLTEYPIETMTLIVGLHSLLVALDECCLLPSEVQVPNYNPYVPCKNFGICSNLLFSRVHPLSLEFGKYPIKSSTGTESNGSNWMDGLRLLWLGKNPTGIKVCNRCGCCTLTHLQPRSAANKAWDQRWLRGCPCGGYWKIPSYLPQPKTVDPDNFLNF